MTQKIRVKRGLKINLPTLDIGELALCTDTKELFIGTDTGNKLINDPNITEGGNVTVSDSAINGNIVVNGVEIKVYDDTSLNTTISGKANTGHTHTLENITDIDVSNKTNGYILSYDSSINKTKFIPLPSGSGSGASDLSTENFTIKEPVVLLTPRTVTKLQTTDITSTSISIKWESSISDDHKDYNVYLNGSLVSTLTTTTHTLTGLSASTNYEIVVKARNNGNYESQGVKLNTRTLGSYVFSKPGTNQNYIECPQMYFSGVEIICNITPKTGSWDNYLVTPTITQSWSLTTQNDGLRFFNTNVTVTVDGLEKLHSSSIPVGVKSVYFVRPSSTRFLTDKLHLLGSVTGISAVQATVYRVRFYLENDLGKLDIVADYDLTYQVVDSQVADILGKNPPLILHGGSFVLT